MYVEDIKNNYHIVKLNEKHDLNDFSCGLDDMDDFLKNDALVQQEDNLNVTYLAKYREEIIGFFSFQCNSPLLSLRYRKRCLTPKDRKL